MKNLLFQVILFILLSCQKKKSMPVGGIHKNKYGLFRSQNNPYSHYCVLYVLTKQQLTDVNNHIVVVVLFGYRDDVENNFVLTAYQQFFD